MEEVQEHRHCNIPKLRGILTHPPFSGSHLYIIYSSPHNFQKQIQESCFEQPIKIRHFPFCLYFIYRLFSFINHSMCFPYCLCKYMSLSREVDSFWSYSNLYLSPHISDLSDLIHVKWWMLLPLSIISKTPNSWIALLHKYDILGKKIVSVLLFYFHPFKSLCSIYGRLSRC